MKEIVKTEGGEVIGVMQIRRRRQAPEKSSRMRWWEAR